MKVLQTNSAQSSVVDTKEIHYYKRLNAFLFENRARGLEADRERVTIAPDKHS